MYKKLINFYKIDEVKLLYSLTRLNYVLVEIHIID